MVKDSLASLAGRCTLADQAAQATDLVYMLSCIVLRAKVIRYVFVLFLQASIYLFIHQHFLGDFYSENHCSQKNQMGCKTLEDT
jgi:hypothetical protein